MSQLAYDESYSENAAENYQRFFVPAIGGPVAEDLIEAAGIKPGERVLDVGCGTGVVTRLAARKLAGTGSVAGLDINPGMLAVAREVSGEHAGIEWYEAGAEAIPLPDDLFDVVLCQMSLQFMDDQLNALREMRRVLAPGGRLVLNLPGPTPRLFGIFAEALTKHIDKDAAPFVHAVFAINNPAEIERLARDAGFGNASVTKTNKHLSLPSADDFLWQYVHSTPLVNAVTQASDEQRQALEREIREGWQEFSSGNGLSLEVGMATLIASQ